MTPFFRSGWRVIPRNVYFWKFNVNKLTNLEAMCSGDDNDWVAADDGGTTPVKGIVAKFDCALPRQLVLGGLITPNNSSCGLSTRWKNIDDIGAC